MTEPSKAAKAAAILHHTWGVESYSTAVEIYDQGRDAPDLVELLEKYEAGIWQELDHLTATEWWENVDALAASIDAAREWEAISLGAADETI